jgi:excisionase family DNA binding protein
MEDLLTTRQVLEYLKVDRITVYRMLNDGRLKGVKIGQHWRFPRKEVERLLNGDAPLEELEERPAPRSGFPTHCAQTIQALFSEVGQMHGLIVAADGQPLTESTYPCSFCRLIQSSPAGMKACKATWRSVAQDTQSNNTEPLTCHAGLQYITAPILEGGEYMGRFISGHFYWQAPDGAEENSRLRTLASAYDLPVEELRNTAAEIPVIPAGQHARVESWPLTAARAIQSILRERTSFISRLQQISDLTQIP